MHYVKYGHKRIKYDLGSHMNGLNKASQVSYILVGIWNINQSWDNVMHYLKLV
jgi:hypothetical protein